MKQRCLVILGMMIGLAGCTFPGPTPETSQVDPPTVTPVLAIPTASASQPISTASTTTAEFTGEGMGTFRVAILIDLSSEPVDHDAARAVVEQASSLLRYQTGYTIQVTEVLEVHVTGSITATASGYLEALDADLPNALVIFSYGDNGWAKLYGGYSGWVVGSGDYRNDYISPVAGDQDIYLAVIHWSERYGACGYGDSVEVISQTSINGECRNQPGTTCVQQYGYSMCSNVVDNLYASTPTHYLAASIVHELLHPFGTGSSDDHYGTPHCQEAMGWTPDNWEFSIDEAEKFFGLCPNMMAAFDRGYRP